MDNVELTKHAKDYIDKLANGINPLDNLPVKDDDIVNNIRISRCLFYVSSVLQNVIDGNIQSLKKKEKKLEFSLSDVQISEIKPNLKAVPVSEFIKIINGVIPENMKKFQYKWITDWLVEKGFLELYEKSDGKSAKRPTKDGLEIGISTECRNGYKGVYEVVLYNTEAQQFLIDNLASIVNGKNEAKQQNINE